MDMSARPLVVQLRILRGMHEGAVVPLAGERFALGAASPCDVILRDAPGQAELCAEEAGWGWREAGFERLVAPGQAWGWGDLVMSLASPGEPWPQDLPALVFERRPDPAVPEDGQVDPAKAAEVASPEDPQAAAAAQATVSESADQPILDAVGADASGAPAVKAKGLPLGLLLACLVALVAVLAVLAVLAQRAAPAKPRPPTPAPSAAGPEKVDLARIEAILARLGLNSSVQARLRGDGRLMLRGVVADNDQLEGLTAALARETRHYSPMLLTQAEFEERARALTPNLPAGIAPLPQPGGMLVLQARRAEVDWVLARQLVESELPEVFAVDHRGWQEPAAADSWRDSRQPAVARSAALNGLVQPTQPLESAAVAPPAGPAVNVVAVVGGPRPFLVLPDGSKWLPGGTFSGLTLRSIDNEAVVFEDAAGKTFRRPR